jgi:ATP-binding cassette subfamily F protein uup
MNLLSAENISRTIGDRTLFSDLNFGIQQGDRIGLIGINGTGKTTLLKVLAGIEPPETGKVSTRKEINIGFLGQNPDLQNDASVFENVFNNKHKLTGLIKSYEQLLEQTLHDEAYFENLEKLTAEMHTHDAWSYEARVKEVISRLGIGDYLHEKVNVLSGGQKKRTALAKILAEEPDILILDEPTNHLDIDTVEWLQNLIVSRFQTLLVVTHDRYFLDGISNSIAELNQGKINKYQGNYAYFLEKKEAMLLNQQSEREKAQNLYKKELEWMRRMPKARGTKSKSRQEAFGELKTKIIGPKTEEKIQLEIKNTRQGGKILELRGIKKTMGDKLLIQHFRHHFLPGEKVGIIGPNGCGKTTFLRLLTGEIGPDTGDILLGENTVIGYYNQEEIWPEKLLNQKLIDVVKDIAPNVELADGTKVSASQFLTRFKFPPAEQYKLVNKLSGGEKKRLQLLRVLIQNPNFLILDEPTNDLDIGTLNELEEFLNLFKGTLVLVSHDRYFMDKLVDHVFVFEGNGQIRDFPGNYTDYKEWRENAKNEAKDKPQKQQIDKVVAQNSSTTTAKRKLSFKEQRELTETELALKQAEERKANILLLLQNASANHLELVDLGMELEKLDEQIDALLLRWVELTET